MDLRLLANPVTQNINMNTPGTWIASTGYTTNAAGARTPTTVSTPVDLQIQAADQNIIKHTDGLNITGIIRSVYVFPQVQSVVRVTAQGGDILVFPMSLGGPNYNWLVTHILEDWHSSDASWGHCLVTLQQK